MRNPIIHLVEKRRRGQYGALFIESTAGVSAYLVVLAWFSRGQAFSISQTSAMMQTLALVLLAVIPLVACLPTARFFSTLRQGRQLDDLLITQLTPESLVDGIAWSSARSVVRLGLLSVVAAVVEAEAAGSGLSLWLFLWFPVLVLLAFMLAYPTLLMNGDRRDQQAVGLLTMGVALGAIFEWGWGDVATAGGLGLITLWCCGWARMLCVASLGSASQTRPARSARDSARLPVRVSHPIWMRELSRQSHQVPGGFWPLMALQVLPVPLLFLVVGERLPEWGRLAFLVALFVMQPLRTVWRSGLALVTEKDGGTLELLQQSPLRARQFVDGWAFTAASTTLLETLLAWPVVSGWLGGHSWIPMTCLLMLIGASGYLGVMMSSVAPNRTIARRFLHVWMALYLGFGVAPIAVAAVATSPEAQTGWLLLPAIGLGACLLFRLWAITRVQEDAYITGFSA